MAQSFFIVGEREASGNAARTYAKDVLGFSEQDSNIVELSYGLFSVEDARKLIDTAYRSGTQGKKFLLVSFTRIFHEAQNALLKLLEEPPDGATMVLIVPSEGIFIPTLRSRLQPLPIEGNATETVRSQIAEQFLSASSSEREKLVSKLLDRAKSDKDDVKQEARQEAIQLIDGLTSFYGAQLHTVRTPADKSEFLELLTDLSSFTPILYERSAPLKLIFEHLSLVIPKGAR